jgi:hypothetical protein
MRSAWWIALAVFLLTMFVVVMTAREHEDAHSATPVTTPGVTTQATSTATSNVVLPNIELGMGMDTQVETASGTHDALLSFEVSNAHEYPIVLNLSDISLPTGIHLVLKGLPKTTTISSRTIDTLSLALHVDSCSGAQQFSPAIGLPARALNAPWRNVILNPSPAGMAGGWPLMVLNAACPEGN